MKTLKTALAVATLALAYPAAAQEVSQDEVNATLGADPQLWAGLFQLAMAWDIDNNCDSIEPRRIAATSYIFGLYNQARAYGYSRRQIRTFQTADSTEARLRSEVGAYYEANGVVEGDAETYCALGRAEMAAGSPAGQLMRTR
ncbi:DUF5333 domain-containing protein [Rhodobacter sp. NTK016B]|uniref:DUF5333 domain-containing protein n=1 Tax=Rhodobacter sp. NTK016B TaxID=2759676 RepID=UPI001A906E22|nr:DUF5333 domain-containing protein [Rhodobacter sp. NTK016B]MBN8291615.1 DUF5333 domain-containing protein [Rhodobacter sp. NTK016B]